MKRLVKHVLATILLLTPLLLNGAQPTTPFVAMDLFDLQWVRDPQISPNGRQIIYIRSRFDVMNDRASGSLWIIDSDGSNHQPLTRDSSRISSPRWSPDGTRIAYISQEQNSAQIHVLWPTTGRHSAITRLQQRPAALSWSPDGSRIAFTQFVAQTTVPIGEPLKKPAGANWNAEPTVFEDTYYRADGAGHFKPGKRQVFVVAATGGMPVQLTHKNYPHNSRLSWAADGSAIYFHSNYADNWQMDRTEQDIYRVTLADKAVTRITQRDGPDVAPQLSSDGRYLLYRGADDVGMYQDSKVYVTRLDEHAPRQLFELDRPVTHAVWAADSKHVIFSFVDNGVTRIARSDLNGNYKIVVSGIGGSAIGRPYASGAFSVARTGAISHDIADARQPADLAVTRSGKTRRLTRLNRDLLAARAMGDAEEIWFESNHDKLPVQGWIVKPPGFNPDKQYPLILEIHGGPQTAYADTFSAEVQLYAAAGYVVLYTNPRGSTSYGGDFTREIHHNYPGHDVDDLLSAVDAVIARGYIDADNLFITGGSGGGLLSAWIVTRTDRFRAAVSQKPVINWYTHTLTADIGHSFWVNFFEGYPWQRAQDYLDKSPIAFVDKVSTPTMLLTGEQDWRTPMSESEQFYQGLRMNGVAAALVRIPNTGHSISARPSGLLNKVRYVLGWFERYRTTNAPADAETPAAP